MKFLLHINLTANRYFPATIFGSQEPLRAYRESFYLKLHELTMINLRFFDNISVIIYCNLWRNKERCFSSCHERGTKKKFLVPIRNRTSDLRITRSDALPLSHRDSTVSEVYYEVHMTHVLHTPRITNVDSETVQQKHFKMKFLLYINLTANRCFPATIFGLQEPLRAYRESFYAKLHEMSMVNLRFFDSTSVIIYWIANFWRS